SRTKIGGSRIASSTSAVTTRVPSIGADPIRAATRAGASARFGGRNLLARAAEASLAPAERLDRAVERDDVEVGPERVGEIQLGVGELPQQEITDALLAAGADEQIGLGRVGHRQVRRQRGFAD